MAILFWLFLFLIAYTYLIYPLLVIGLSGLLTDRDKQTLERFPSVTMVVPAYNEEGVIEEKIHNCLSLDYPQGKLNFILGSDGSSDRTAALLKGYQGKRFLMIFFPEREGKTRVLNKLIPKAEGEIVLFSDANSMYGRNAVLKLVRHFSDPAVGGVCGRLELINPSGAPGGEGEGLYWHYENQIKGAEGRLGTVISANGSIFAVRRELLEPLPTRAAINDDFILTLQVIQRGKRVVYEPEATAVESTSPDMESEFQRKIRISSLNFNAFPQLLPLLLPRYGFAALALFSHKLLRWLVPFLAVGLLLSNLFLLDQSGIYPTLLAGQGLVYLGALLGFLGDLLLDDAGPLIPFYYLGMVNTALVIGFWRSLTGTQTSAWQQIRK